MASSPHACKPPLWFFNEANVKIVFAEIMTELIVFLGAVNLLYEGKKTSNMPSKLDHVLTFLPFCPRFS